MEPETQQPIEPMPHDVGEPQTPEMGEAMAQAGIEDELTPVAPPEVERGIRWVFIGPQGLRAGWSAVMFIVLWLMFAMLVSFVLVKTRAMNPKAGFTTINLFLNEVVMLLALLGAASLMALLEQRRLMDYNLTGPRRMRNFLFGLVAGFVALSVLVGVLAAGGWLHFGGAALSGKAIFEYALIWGCMFLMVGCAEEGAFRCYLQYTLTRGINFWWALGVVAFLCALLVRNKGNGVWGDYALALLGLVPCFMLHLKKAHSSAFWQAAWVTSTLFGYIHTSNGGENWIGIFAAGAIGFVFCVSIKVTGSAWWAIGLHAGWDWGETYFYGTPDSGLVVKGHFLNTAPAGNAFWSGGADGPEGSVLIIGILVSLLIWLLAVYGRSREQGTRGPREQENNLAASSY